MLIYINKYHSKINMNPHWAVEPKIEITKLIICIVSIDKMVNKDSW